MKPDSTPHDIFAKAAFRNPLVYRPFIREHTPAELFGHIDRSKIEVMPVGFPLSNPLQAADIVLRAPLLNGSGWVYWLLEVQASRDSNMALRLLLYKMEILKYHLQSEQGRYDSKPPMILTTVIYMGLHNWHPSTLDPFAPLDASLRDMARAAFVGDADCQCQADRFGSCL